jgi:hypothetical protein
VGTGGSLSLASSDNRSKLRIPPVRAWIIEHSLPKATRAVGTRWLLVCDRIAYNRNRLCTGPMRTVIISILLFVFLVIQAAVPGFSRRPVYRLRPDDQAFLEDLEHRAFLYFWEQADSRTGLVRDRARTDGSALDSNHRDVASIAATGFGLTALCIAADRHWMDSELIRGRVLTTLAFFSNRAPQYHGWFYHWMDAATGERVWQSEVSSIDTALLLAGVLTVRGYYGADSEIGKLSASIYDRVDFRWMLNGDSALLSHGWKPESGFLKNRWDHYSEESILYLLAIGSPVHSISPDSWYAWKRDPITYHGFSYIGTGPLFTHQYSHAWVDFRGLKERRPPRIDYFANSVTATRAHRQFCIDLSTEFRGYTESIWGITASDSVRGYVAWGGPPRHPDIDGTVVPCAAGGSLMFAPDICLPALRSMHAQYGKRIYSHYGFADAFNPTTGWIDTDVIGIDLGITLLSAENLRRGAIWKWFSRNPETSRALRLAGLRRQVRAELVLDKRAWSD